MKLEQQVRKKVDKLLQDLLSNPSDPKNYEVVLSRLTSMAILGVVPPSGLSKTESHDEAGNTTSVGLCDEDFSFDKENFIAP